MSVGLGWKPSTQADIESDWVAYWASQLGVPVIYHRKLWEHCYVLQALYDHGALRAGARGVGFGCGTEPLASFFAARGAEVLITDLEPDRQEAQGWRNTNEHATSLDAAFHAHLVSREVFDRNVSHRWADMNDIPGDIEGRDFCWSVCALEHVGSIAKGLAFIENSLRTLKPGGVAVHTTEFNFWRDDLTIDNWVTVLFQRRHFEELHRHLTEQGHDVGSLDFDVGDGPMDRFIDVPPFAHDWPTRMNRQWGSGIAQLKLSIDGFAATCFGIVVKKKS